MIATFLHSLMHYQAFQLRPSHLAITRISFNHRKTEQDLAIVDALRWVDSTFHQTTTLKGITVLRDWNDRDHGHLLQTRHRVPFLLHPRQLPALDCPQPNHQAPRLQRCQPHPHRLRFSQLRRHAEIALREGQAHPHLHPQQRSPNRSTGIHVSAA